ncbi:MULTISPECIES: ScbR family autoregulator-binding transcription factor [Arthrobacter]|uniref:ScbR family autoregulator-binding transcription factor n=2 Tax=Arthrobacter TaxID=1663 RepID=A0ABU9KGP0_9MICC|nr:ScbR family autoregulator-binding transcription factor [Arthrobacter sp. YJM1]MDP5225706.1 ScbR family autoregulator-binding transcription factor [Arthrobacter sp. YJM1]
MQQRAIETRNAVIEGSSRVFEASGYGDTSLSDIASESSVTKGALYFHFKSKEEIALAVIAEQHNRSRLAGERVMERGLPALATMRELCRVFGQQMLDDAVVRAGIRLTFEASAFDADVTGPYQDWVDTMTFLGSKAQDEGDMRPEINVQDFARFLVGTFTGGQMVSNVLTGRADLMERIEQMWGFMLPAIAVEGWA